jgi:hypothetical protein
MNIRGEECLAWGTTKTARSPLPTSLPSSDPSVCRGYNYFWWRFCRYTDLQPSEFGNNVGGPLHGAAA